MEEFYTPVFFYPVAECWIASDRRDNIDGAPGPSQPDLVFPAIFTGTLNFLRLIAEKGRAGEIAEIVAELDTLVAAEHRVLDVELTTAHELSDEEFGRILEQIETASGRTVQAERKVDPELIGGIVLQAGSMRLDASVRGRLERLRQDLTHARS